MHTIAEAKSEIAKALDAVGKPGAPNPITERELCRWAIEYLNDWDQEIEEHPEEANASHWNMWLRDNGTEDDAPFAVILFCMTEMELLCGRGNGYAVRVFSERVAYDPTRILDGFRAKFAISHESLKIERELAECWLGRSFGIRSKHAKEA